MSESPSMDRAACARLERIQLQRADGQEPSVEERAFRQEHLKRCADCRAEQGGLALLALDRGPRGAAPELDELSRRRLINQAVAAAAQPATPVPEAPPARRASGRLAVAVALAASVLIGTVGGLLSHHFSQPLLGPVEPPTRMAGIHAKAPAPTPATPLQAKVLLQSGKATLDGTPMAAARTMRPGRVLRVATGQMVLQLPMGSKMLLRPRSTLGITRLDGHRVRLHLRQGEVLARVTRRGPGQEFEVTTDAGRVVVRGTYFSVRVDGGKTLLSVLEGRVRVVERGGAIRELTGGQAITLGRGGVRPVAVADARSAAGHGRLLSLLGNGSEGASARIISKPAGATVTVDGQTVGKTPLVAALYAGKHKLAVRRAGYRSARESLTLRPGDVLLREYHLGRRLLARAPRAEPPAPDRPKRGADPAASRVRLKELEQKVNSLKEKVFRSKKSLLEMNAAVRGRGLSGAQLVVRHANEMGKAFRLVRAEYALDGARIFLKASDGGKLASSRKLQVINQALAPGEHTLGVRLVFRGNGYGIFPYFKGYKFDVRSSHTFTVGAGKRTTVKATAYEKGLFTKFEDLPAIKFSVEHAALGAR